MAYEEIGEEYEVVGYDDVGYDEIGADASEVERLLAAAVSGEEMVVGARRRHAVKRHGRPQASRGQVIVKKRAPQDVHEFPLGFDSGANIAAAGAQQVVATPLAMFRGDRLMVPSDIAGNFVLTQILVGMENQMPGTAALPCRAFQEDSNGARLKLNTCPPSVPITLGVMNVSGGASWFRALLYGTVVK